MSNSLDCLGGNLLAAYLTSAVRHAWADNGPADEIPAEDRLLFGLLRVALTRSPPAGMAEYAQRLAMDVCHGPGIQERSI